jgi:hypothetical protein
VDPLAPCVCVCVGVDDWHDAATRIADRLNVTQVKRDRYMRRRLYSGLLSAPMGRWTNLPLAADAVAVRVGFDAGTGRSGLFGDAREQVVSGLLKVDPGLLHLLLVLDHIRCRVLPA